MKTLETTCQVCRRSIRIEVEEPAMFSDAVMAEMATCDQCFDQHDDQERTRIAKYHKAIERECNEPGYRHPYAD